MNGLANLGRRFMTTWVEHVPAEEEQKRRAAARTEVAGLEQAQGRLQEGARRYARSET